MAAGHDEKTVAFADVGPSMKVNCREFAAYWAFTATVE
jgi:hypothetical protein